MAARTQLTKTVGANLAAQASEPAVVMTAADVPNFNQFDCTGREIVIAQNTDVAVRHVTISTSPDYLGRLGDVVAYSLAAGAIAVFGPLPTNGWQQPDGHVYLSADSALVKFGVVQLP